MPNSFSETVVAILAMLLYAGIFGLVFWIPSEVLRKAGYPRWFALGLLVPVLNLVGVLLFAFSDWPIHDELAWLRLKAGADPGPLLEKAEMHAVRIEKQGDWAGAAEVYKDLAARATGEEKAGYYLGCLRRLRERAGVEDLTD